MLGDAEPTRKNQRYEALSFSLSQQHNLYSVCFFDSSSGSGFYLRRSLLQVVPVNCFTKILLDVQM